MTPSAIKLDVSPYVTAHRCYPRGRGCWTFQILDQKVYCSDYRFSLAVLKVKKMAAQIYRDRGLTEIPVLTVLPEWRPEND